MEGIDIGKENVFEMFALSGLHWTINMIQGNSNRDWLVKQGPRIDSLSKGEE